MMLPGSHVIIVRLQYYDRIPDSPMPVLGVTEVRLIFTVSARAYASVNGAWFPALPYPNSTSNV